MRRIWSAAIPVLLAINICVAPTSGRREGRAYLGCKEQLVMAEDTVYEEEMKCHNVTRVRTALIKVYAIVGRAAPTTINICTFLTPTVDVHDPL